MGDLSLALNNALSGLNINRQSLAVLSQNIANANTKGYSRQTIKQSAVYLDGQGAGTSIQDIGRSVDNYLLAAIRSQNARVGAANITSDYYDRTQILIGKPGSQNSIDAYTRGVFNALQTLSNTPESSTARVNAVNNAATLASQASQLSRSLQDLRFQADTDIANAVSEINSNILELQRLNATISENQQQAKPVSDLLDKRDLLLNDISQYLDIRTNLKANGSVDIYTSTGVSLLDTSAYRLSYNPTGAVDSFIKNATLGPLEITRLDARGQPAGQPITLVSSGTAGNITNILGNGKLKSLVDLRDRQIPNALAQLDNLVANLRDQFNAVHNTGIGFPGANSYTGTRGVGAADATSWAGKVRFAALDPDGKPLTSPYTDEATGIRPFTLDLSRLDSGNGAGYPSVQSIIDEFNQFYTPANKAQVGNINNIRLASGSSAIPGAPPQFNFDFDLDNLSATSSNFYVTNVSVTDDAGGAVTPVTSTIPKITLASSNTYVTTNGSTTVTINTSATTPNGLRNGDRIFLSTPPGGTINGIPTSELGGYVTVSNVTASSFQITTATPADNSPAASVAGQTGLPPYATVAAGEAGRTTSKGSFNATLNTTSQYFTVTATVGVDDGTGNIKSAQVSYRVNNNQVGALNSRYAAQSVSGQGTLVTPNTATPAAKAILVDENGNELPIINGKYSTLQKGFLKFIATGSNNVIGIDSLDSVERGRPNDIPPVAATSRSFSHYFELNNFFKSNGIPGTDTTTNSALNLQVEQRLIDNPNLISLGKLVQSTATDSTPVYTYERASGDNSVVQKLAQLGVDTFNFGAAGGLGQSRQTFASYAAQFVGSVSSNANSAKSIKDNQQTLYDGFQQRSDAISGVNLDEELANTVIYQNAYSASARVITVTKDLYDTLLQAV